MHFYAFRLFMLFIVVTSSLSSGSIDGQNARQLTWLACVHRQNLYVKIASLRLLIIGVFLTIEVKSNRVLLTSKTYTTLSHSKPYAIMTVVAKKI